MHRQLCRPSSRLILLAAIWMVCALSRAAAGQDLEIALHAGQADAARLTPGVTLVQTTFLADAAANRIQVEFLSTIGDLQTSIVDPAGFVISATTVDGVGGTYCFTDGSGGPPSFMIRLVAPSTFSYAYQFPTRGPGAYLVRIQADPGLAMEVPVLISVVLDSPIKSTIFTTQQTATQGGDAVVCVPVFNGAASVGGATVTATIVTPSGVVSTITLLDDGLDADGAAGDGIYSSVFTAAEQGTYTLRGTATGQIAGDTFLRNSGTTLEVTAPGSHFASTALTTIGVDDNNNGLFDRLVTSSSVVVVTAGHYGLNVVLQTTAGHNFRAHGWSDLDTGTRTITASIDAAAIRANNENGPFTITSAELVLYGPGRATTADRLDPLSIATPSYTLAQFDGPALEIAGPMTSTGIDTNADGKFDILRVGLPVRCRLAAEYAFTVQLNDGCGTQLQFLTGAQQIAASGTIQTLGFDFSGTSVGMNGVDGPYLVQNLLVSGADGSIVAPLVGATGPLQATAFDSYTPFRDRNHNGIPDACDIAAGTSADCNGDGVPDEVSPQPAMWTYAGDAAPYGRSGHAMTYDQSTGRVLLHGGRTPEYYVRWDTLAWNGSTWTHLADGPALVSAAMVYDSSRQRVVLFGGVTATPGVASGQTWELDMAASPPWTLVSTTGPSPRWAHSMAYDAARHMTILFGGIPGGYTLGDTWGWDGVSWVQLATGGPSPRYSGAMAYDESHARVVLFGGANTDQQLLGDTWEWDGVSWQERTGPHPSPRWLHALAYDPLRARTVLCGGNYSASETWEWDGSTWTLESLDGAGDRSGFAMAYDQQRAALVLFGGFDGSYLRDTWVRTTIHLGPVIASNPTPAGLIVAPGQTVAFSMLASSTNFLTYQWRRGGVPLADGGRLSGTATSHMTITSAQTADSGIYDVVLSDSCGAVTTASATLAVRTCRADYTNDGVLGVADFLAFLALYSAGSPMGDFNSDGSITVADFTAFLAAYAAGC
jgi:hypothetical protein